MTLNRDTIVQLGNKLAPAAATFGRLRTLLLDPTTELQAIVKLIRVDPALTFHIVRMGNSVMFGGRGKTDSLEMAVTRLGLRDIFRAVGLAALKQVCQRTLPTYGLSANRFWENAVATAAAAEVLAGRAGRDAGLAYSAGLLRTLGLVILNGANAEGLTYPGEVVCPSVADWERHAFGTTSAQVGGCLLDYWRFPGEVVDSVRDHQRPLESEESNIGASLLNLACGVTARFGLDLPGEAGDWEMSPAKLTLAGVSETDLEDCAEQARGHYATLSASVG